MSNDLPCKECKGQCCTFPAMNPQEFQKLKPHLDLKDKRYQILRKKEMVIIFDKKGNCPLLNYDGSCSAYEDRPDTCKKYGVVPEMPCAYLYPEEAEQSFNKMAHRNGLLNRNRAERRRAGWR
ncbi:MAG: YkgJ family cysteine cluster protein [Magnetococcus sp. YQC-3]